MTVIRIVSTLAMLGYLALALLAFREARRTVVRSFAFFLLAMLFWQVEVTLVSFTHDPVAALHRYRWVVGLGASFSIFYAQFSRDFLGVRSHRWMIWVGYGLVVFFSLYGVLGGPAFITDIYASPNTGLWLPTFGPVVLLWAAITYSYLVYSAALLFRYRQRSASPQMRVRIKYVLVGLILVFLGSMVNLTETLKPYPIDMVANVLNASLIGYAIFRHQLLDIAPVIRKGLLYSMLTICDRVGLLPGCFSHFAPF